MIGYARGRVICIYTLADRHWPAEATLFMKTSVNDGLTWSEPKEILSEKESVYKGITGFGYNNEGEMLLWYRDGCPGKAWVTHALYKTDGDSVTLVSAPDIALRGGHIGNIFRIPEQGLFCFYNTYGKLRSWGMLKSTDEGLSWEQIPIEENLSMADCPVEIECACATGSKILLLGRKDTEEGTVAMFQMQSDDYGKTWSKEYTNIADAYGNSPSVIFDGKTGKIDLYYFVRFAGELKHRTVSFADVWDAPQNWSEAELLVCEPYRGWDTGNVKTVAVGRKHICAYYAGTPTTTGVYGVIVHD